MQGDSLKNHPLSSPQKPLFVSDFGHSNLGFAESPVCNRDSDLDIRISNLSSSPQLITDNCKTYTIKIVEHYFWVGARHTDLYPRMVDILKNVWHCKIIVVDSTGVGEPVAAFLREALGSRVVPFKFTARSKSDLGFKLLAAINSGHLKMYAADGSPEYQEMFLELTRAKSVYRPNQTLNFFVDPSVGHDDFLMSLALVVEASGLYEPRIARGQSRVL